MKKCVGPSHNSLQASRIHLHAAIGRAIQSRRVEAGLSLRAIAPHVGVSSNFLDKIEEGVSPCPIHVLVALANVFDCTLDDLVPVGAEVAA